MREWTVMGADRESGEDRAVPVTALTEEEARQIAEGLGLLVESVRERQAEDAPRRSRRGGGGFPSSSPVPGSRTHAAVVLPVRYTYSMVQIPPTITATDTGGEAARYLEGVVNREASEGWEFYRVDTISVRTPAGCLASLLGHRDTYVDYSVLTFRRPAD